MSTPLSFGGARERQLLEFQTYAPRGVFPVYITYLDRPKESGRSVIIPYSLNSIEAQNIRLKIYYRPENFREFARTIMEQALIGTGYITQGEVDREGERAWDRIKFRIHRIYNTIRPYDQEKDKVIIQSGAFHYEILNWIQGTTGLDK